MDYESEIFEGERPVITNNNYEYHDFKLLKTTANANLYIATKQGKKFLIKTAKDNSEYQQRLLRREYELAIGCDHPHIVHMFIYEPCLEVGDGIVMEYLECRTLAEYLAEDPSRAERERIFEELLSAVGYLHKRGVIHNDLKPDNILVTRADNRLKLIDFGMADADSEAVLRNIGCTPRYASPELRDRRGDIDSRSDIYSIGVIMNEILGDSAVARRCLEQDRDRRYSNIEALRHAWQNRYRGWRILRNICLTLLVITPLVLYLVSYSVAKQREDTRERLLADMETEMIYVVNAARDTVSSACYLEFAAMHVYNMWKQLETVRNRYISLTDDIELQSLLSSRYEQLYKLHYETLSEEMTSYPSYYLIVEDNERAYLDSLIRCRIPYSPYQSNIKDKKRQ